LPPQDNLTEQISPEEALDAAYQKLKLALAQDLLTLVKDCTPDFFERLVVKLLVKMGYGGSIQDAGRAIGRSGDEGIDGIIKEDRLGLDAIYIQAKKWEGTVGRPEIQKFVGALAGQGAKKGVFITTSSFSKDAYEYAKNMKDTKVVLVDGEQLTQYMIDYNLGVSIVSQYELKKIDSDFFADE
jgi:restriction system protein